MSTEFISKTVLPPPLPFEVSDMIEMGVEEEGNSKAGEKKVSKQLPKSVPVNIMKAIKEYDTLDGEIKNTAGRVRILRKELKKHKFSVFQWMTSNKVPSIRLKKRNLILEIRETELKKKPTPEQQTAKLSELFAKGITDPVTIYTEIQKCGSVTKENRLYKRKIISDAKKKKIEEAAKKALASDGQGGEIVMTKKKKKKNPMTFVEGTVETPSSATFSAVI